MPDNPILLLTENRAEELALGAIFRDEIINREVEILSLWSSSSIIGAAEKFLLESSAIPVVMVINCGQGEERELGTRRATITRILARITLENWHLSFAVPDVDAWIQADPSVKEAMDRGDLAFADRHGRAVAVSQARTIGGFKYRLDREAIAAAYPEFRKLDEFIQAHRPAPQPTA